MKQILLLLAVSVFSLSGIAQIDNPRLNFSSLKSSVKHEALVLPFPAKQGLSKPDIRKLKANRAKHVLYRAKEFDPAWANRFQTALDSVMEATNAKGASVAVYSPEYGSFSCVSGISHPGVPITPEMRFGIGSNTKLFIAVTVLKLVEEGVLTLDDHLYQWLPQFQFVDSTITIRQLLKHESGLFDYWNDEPSLILQTWPDTSRFWTSTEIIESIGPPHFAPGKGYSYSNTNYVLAGMIIEAATGNTWVENLHAYIFDPLNLTSTFVGAAEPRNGPCAAEWDSYSGVLVTNVPMTSEYSQANACGAILSTASEMVQWYNALFDGSVLSDSSLQLLLSLEPSSMYGLGITGGTLNQGFYGHTGGMLGFASLFIYDIQTQSTICMLFNDRYSDLASKFDAMMNVFYGDYPKTPDDAGIAGIIAPADHNCENTITPRVKLVNYGTNQLTTAAIHYQTEGDEIRIFNWSGMLNPGESEIVVLPAMMFDTGQQSIEAYTSLPNGAPEGHTFNDLAMKGFYVELPGSFVSELPEGFEGGVFPSEGWAVNPVSNGQWGITSLTSLNGSKSLVRCNYNDQFIGTYYDFELPLLNISGWYNTDFKFDYAYKLYPGMVYDTLEVMISRDCGNSWTTLFKKGGWELPTVSPGYDMFYPQTPEDWKHESFPLQIYEGDMLIRFRAVNGYGNNLYIDNIFLDLLTAADEPKPFTTLSTYPNPFTTAVWFTYYLPEPSKISLRVFDSYGKLVAEPVNSFQQKGEQKIEWNGGNLPAGIYFFRLQTGNHLITEKIVKMH
jgi:D-alanyl-D-alanine carboxypeptidase